METPATLAWALTFCFWLRTLVLIPNVFMVYYYEKYHQWVAVDRWTLQKPASSMGRRVDSAVEIPDCIDHENDLLHPLSASESSNPPLPVQHLGKRGQLLYRRRVPWDMKDWLAVPVSGLLFYIMPQIHAQICHLWTNSLDYQVAAKPQLKQAPSMASLSADGTFYEQVSSTNTDCLLPHSRGEEAGDCPFELSVQLPPHRQQYPSQFEQSQQHQHLEIQEIPVLLNGSARSPVITSASSKGDEGFFEEDSDALSV
jgi:hypothetical protein